MHNLVAVNEHLPRVADLNLDLLESAMIQHPQIEIVPVHRFADGIYAREITIPAGTLLTGKIHKTEHLNIISKGSITVWSKKDGIKRIHAPFSFVAKPGTRRLGYAHEDTVWTTIHATQETDLNKLEAELIEPHEITPLELQEIPCLG
jgi:hypothetical protein